jgi:hypothetical protein
MSSLISNLAYFIKDNNLQQVDKLLSNSTKSQIKITRGDERFHNSDGSNFWWNFMGRNNWIRQGNLFRHQVTAKRGFYRLKRDLGIDETTNQLLTFIPKSIESGNYKETKCLIKEVEDRIDLSEKKLLEIISSQYRELKTSCKKSDTLSYNIFGLSPEKHENLDDWLDFRKQITTQFDGIDELTKDIDEIYPLRHPINIVDYILIIREIIEGSPHKDLNSIR